MQSDSFAWAWYKQVSLREKKDYAISAAVQKRNKQKFENIFVTS